MTSFYDSDRNDGKGAWATGSIINPQDNSGRDFLKNDIIGADPEVGYYMDNAKTNQRYDFKATNGTDQPVYGEKDYYRGMPLGKNSKGVMIYTSARDVGNIAAGYVAGIHAVPWSMARKEFDKLQSIQDGSSTTEGISTQNAQRVGWDIGHEKAVSGLIPRLWRARTTIWNYLKK
jgi:hypothetical protein